MNTWGGLCNLLDAAEVSYSEFFFTNAYVGLKDGGPTGDVTQYPAPGYRAWCRDFLGHQINVMRPRVVLTLGEPAWTALAAVAEPRPWPPGRLPPPEPATTSLCGHPTIVVAAKHTSIAPRAANKDSLRIAWGS